MWPICAESAVKPQQTNQPTNHCSLAMWHAVMLDKLCWLCYQALWRASAIQEA